MPRPAHHLLLLLLGCQSGPAVTGDVADELLPSTNVGDTYRILVRVPPAYDPSRLYPAVFQLDATSFGPEFEVTAGEASALEASGEIEEVVIVGVGYPYDDPLLDREKGRMRDYVTRVAEGEPGGAPDFLAFLEEELVPWVDARWSIDTGRRALFGHSLGGYFSLYALLETQGAGAFTGFVAGDPSTGWDDLRLFALEAALDGAELPAVGYMPTARFDGAVQTLLASELAARLEAHPGLTFEHRVLETDHFGALRQGFREGLVALFGGAP